MFFLLWIRSLLNDYASVARVELNYKAFERGFEVIVNQPYITTEEIKFSDQIRQAVYENLTEHPKLTTDLCLIVFTLGDLGEKELFANYSTLNKCITLPRGKRRKTKPIIIPIAQPTTTPTVQPITPPKATPTTAPRTTSSSTLASYLKKLL